MNLKFVVILFVLSLTSGSCGLLNWFDEWGDKLDPNNAKTNCREKRNAEENGIKPDITKSTADKADSLMDIREGKLTAESEPTGTRRGNLKTKRCSNYRVSAYNPIVGAARRSSKLLPLVKRNSTPEEQCNACVNRPTCKLLGQCAQCNEHCKGIAIYTDDMLTPWTNQTVGIAHRMTPPHKNDLFSKTLFPVSTHRDGETKDIICRIVGITDTSDIETVTIWVTTHSNTPPNLVNTVSGDLPRMPKKIKTAVEQNLRESEGQQTIYNKKSILSLPSLAKMFKANRQAPSPDIQARFNDYDDDNDNTFSRFTNNGMEKIKANPDVIEGPPPFVGSNNLLPLEPSPTNNDINLEDSGISIDKIGTLNKPIVVQPKEYLSDDSEEDDADDDGNDDADASPASAEPSLSPSRQSTTSKNIIIPPILSKLRELASSRVNRISDLKDQRQKLDGGPSVKEGFIGNMFKSRQNKIDDNTKSQDASILPMYQMEQVSANENQIASIKLPVKSDDQITKINEAIQEVKSMVKNIQEEASKASEKRLLGASITEDASDDLLQNSIAPSSIPSLQNNQKQQILPSQVADNLKKVNQYLINRAQDALDIIGPNQGTNTPFKPAKVLNEEDEHSEITKNTITNFKKMPQFLLERFKDSLSGFENKPLDNTAKGVDTNDIREYDIKKNMELTNRLGSDDGNKIDQRENLAETNGYGSNDNRDETVVGQPKGNIWEDESSPNTKANSNAETPTANTYKNKFEKYITELKEKSSKIYSREKYPQNQSTKASKMVSLPIKVENPVGSTGPINDVVPVKEEIENNYGKYKTASSKTLISSNDFKNQTDLLRKKLKEFIAGVKSKATTIPVSTKIEEITPVTSSEKSGLVRIGDQDPNSFIKSVIKPQSLIDLSQPSLDKPYATEEELPQNFSQDTPTDQVVGESKPNNKEEVFNFLPTIPTLPGTQSTEPSNKLQKILEDFKAKQSSLFKSDSKIPNPVSEFNNEPEDKKELLKTKFKSYVENLKKPVKETVGQPEMSLNQRMSDQISKLNNKMENDMKNYLGATPDIFKKDLLKEKLRNYVSSLRKPMGSKMIPDFVRETSETQKEELNSLKKKLESLLKAKEPTQSANFAKNPLVSKAEPNVKPTLAEIPSMDTNIISVNSRTKAIDVLNNNIVGDIQHLGQGNDKKTVISQTVDSRDSNNLAEGGDNLDWSHSLGKIVQSTTQPKDIFFLGNGIKLPLKLTEGPNGMDLSVDLEKLCSCYNATSCSKNQTAIEETVGAILEKEAELNEQLKDDSLDDVKINPVLGSPFTAQSVAEEATRINRKPTIMQKILSNINSKTVQKRKSNIFKRSSDVRGLSPEITTIKNVLEQLKKENDESSKNNVLKNSDLPILPSFDAVADELTNWGQKVQKSVTNSIKQIEEIKEDIEDKEVIGAQQNPNLFLKNNMPTFPIYNPDWVQDSLNGIKAQAEKTSNNMLGELEHANDLNNLLNLNGLRTTSGVDLLNNDYIKSLTPDGIINGMLKSNGLNVMGLPLENPLNNIKKQLNDVIKNFEKQKTINKITQRTGLNRFRLPKKNKNPTIKDPLSLINDFQGNLPKIPYLQNKINEINNDVVKITDTYQFGKADILEKKLKQLDDEVQNYYEKNEKLLSRETNKLLGGHNKEIVEKEVNIINRIISWIKSLASGIKI